MLRHEVLNENDLREYSAVVLAYIGDAVFELAARSHVLLAGNRKVKNIHDDTVKMVRAASQARAIRQIFAQLSEAEQDIVMRGRNAKGAPPKHANPEDYQLSTGFEALLGYLYLKGDKNRLSVLLDKVFLVHNGGN
ncbi:MAG TPA: ribonuclease III domain-containing protein [Syntrophomonadaceae bacterium]|nr:ribonuclease III domain-containing protein [Syntrophomonadaceae bacterium]